MDKPFILKIKVSNNQNYPLFIYFCLILLILFALTPTTYSSTSLPFLKLDFEESEFQRFTDTYMKIYDSESEYSLRLSIFRKNLRIIHESNKLNKEYTLGINCFADLSLEEYQDKCLMKKKSMKKSLKKKNKISKPLNSRGSLPQVFD